MHSHTRDQVLRSVQSNGLNFEFLEPIYQDDPIIALEAVKQYDFLWQYVSERIKQDRSFLLAAIDFNHNLFYQVHPMFNDDLEIVLKAVKENGKFLKFVSPRLQDHEEVAREAVAQNWEAHAWISERLSQDDAIFQMAKEACWRSIKENPDCYRSLSERLNQDEDLFLEVVKQDPKKLKYLSNHPLINDLSVLIKILHHNGLALEYLDRKYRENIYLVTCAIEQNIKALRQLKFGLVNNKDLMLRAVQIDPYEGLYCLGYELTDDDDIIWLATMTIIQRNFPLPSFIFNQPPITVSWPRTNSRRNRKHSMKQQKKANIKALENQMKNYKIIEVLAMNDETRQKMKDFFKIFKII